MSGRSALRSFPLVCAALAASVAATRSYSQTEIADLREDVRGLTQRVNDLSLRVEQLEHDSAVLKAKVDASGKPADAVTAEQLNGAVADLNASIRSAVGTSRAEILQTVATQMENLARQTNRALDSVARTAPAVQASSLPAAPAPRTEFADVSGKPAVSYTVVKGDSIGLIAKKTGARAQDIIDANKLVDPSRIQVGQVLVVPGGKP